MNALLNTVSPVNGCDRPVNGRGLGHLKLTDDELVRLAADMATGTRPFQPSVVQTTLLTGVSAAAIRAEIKARATRGKSLEADEIQVAVEPWRAEIKARLAQAKKNQGAVDHRSQQLPITTLELIDTPQGRQDFLRRMAQLVLDRGVGQHHDAGHHPGAGHPNDDPAHIPVHRKVMRPVVKVDLVDTPEGRQGYLRQVRLLFEQLDAERAQSIAAE
jgi:hypothetical protein